MKLVISVDVEEEGLFSGRYPRVPPGVKNVSQLDRLEFISSEFGLPLTLLVTYRVAADPACRQILEPWRKNWKAEIGAHLHHWNTPPFQDLAYPEPVSSELIARPLLEAKLQSLVSTLKDHLEVDAKAFRMGRFDWGQNICRLLPEYGLSVDSSVVPSRRLAGVPDHLLARGDPFRYTFTTPAGVSFSILEVPVTVVPLLPNSSRIVHKIASVIPWRGRDALLTGFGCLGVAGIQPAWFPLKSMKWAVRLHRSRGGKVLTMFLHSSELHPGANPRFRTEKQVELLVEKIGNFLRWLTRTEAIQGLTLSELHASEPICDAVELV